MRRASATATGFRIPAQVSRRLGACAASLAVPPAAGPAPGARSMPPLLALVLAMGVSAACPGSASAEAQASPRHGDAAARVRQTPGALFDAADPDGSMARLRGGAASGAPREAVLPEDLAFETAPGVWRAFCGPEGEGRRLAFHMAGAWGPDGSFFADPERFFLTCTGGENGRCVLFGYDPGALGPDGQLLPAVYPSCGPRRGRAQARAQERPAGPLPCRLEADLVARIARPGPDPAP